MRPTYDEFHKKIFSYFNVRCKLQREDGTRAQDDATAVDICVGLETLYREGFSEEDAIAYLRCTEEYNPDLDEEVALRRMATIKKKYVKHE